MPILQSFVQGHEDGCGMENSEEGIGGEEMKVKVFCKAYGGTGSEIREIRVGDVLTPVDGSSMPWGLHRKLDIRGSEGHVTGFRPVRVLSVEGEMLAVEPVDSPESWKNDDAYKNSIAPIWGPGSGNQLGNGFWIHSRHCSWEV